VRSAKFTCLPAVASMAEWAREKAKKSVVTTQQQQQQQKPNAGFCARSFIIHAPRQLSESRNEFPNQI
jgi:hypothetical protein